MHPAKTSEALAPLQTVTEASFVTAVGFAQGSAAFGWCRGEMVDVLHGSHLNLTRAGITERHAPLS